MFCATDWLVFTSHWLANRSCCESAYWGNSAGAFPLIIPQSTYMYNASPTVNYLGSSTIQLQKASEDLLLQTESHRSASDLEDELCDERWGIRINSYRPLLLSWLSTLLRGVCCAGRGRGYWGGGVKLDIKAPWASNFLSLWASVTAHSSVSRFQSGNPEISCWRKICSVRCCWFCWSRKRGAVAIYLLPGVSCCVARYCKALCSFRSTLVRQLFL